MSTPTLMLLLLLTLLLLALVGWWRAADRTRRGNLRRQRAAFAGEAEAELMLAKAGYDILDRQITGRWQLTIDGQPYDVHSRADLLVRRRGRRFIAEVKTGDLAPDPTRPATRRQLLEYLLAFDVHGVLLVDMEQRQIRRVDFPSCWR